MNNEVKRKIFTLCGSTKYKNQFVEVETFLTLMGIIPLAPAIYSKSEGVTLSEKTIKHLFKFHLNKIEISDGIYVIDVDKYIGDSTKKEIEFAKTKNKEIRYYSDEIENIKKTIKKLEVKNE